jgi:hypothetical protein
MSPFLAMRQKALNYHEFGLSMDDNNRIFAQNAPDMQ